MSTEMLAGIAVALLSAVAGLLGWIVIKLNGISTLIAVAERRLLDGDKRIDDHEDRIRAVEKIYNQKENL